MGGIESQYLSGFCFEPVNRTGNYLYMGQEFKIWVVVIRKNQKINGRIIPAGMKEVGEMVMS